MTQDMADETDGPHISSHARSHEHMLQFTHTVTELIKKVWKSLDLRLR